MSPRTSPFPSCFRPSTSDAAVTHHHPLPPPPPTTSGSTNLTTCLYLTELGLFSLTWSRTLFGHSLNLHLHPLDNATCSSPLFFTNPPSLPSLAFRLRIKPYCFWQKHGSKRLKHDLHSSLRIQVFWDLSKARFGSRPEPESGFYIAVVVEREIVLLVGDLTKQAIAKTRARKRENQVHVLRREHVYGNKVYSTIARFGGKNRRIYVDCSVNNDGRLSFDVDGKRVLEVKRLKWKFRGNEKIEVDGVHIQVSWDVYNWLFDDAHNGHVVFMFGFETTEDEQEQESEVCGGDLDDDKNGAVQWQQNPCNSYGMEWRKMRKSLVKTTRSLSSSSISMSSASSGCGSSSIMEWACTEENDLTTPNGFSLLVYAWRK